MRHLICKSPRNLAFGQEETPLILAGQALVKVRKIGICGTDLHAVDGTQPYFSYPRILGHELAVEIAEVRPQSKLATGSVACVLPYFNCNACHMCLSGRPNACVNLRVCGVHVDGGMREYFSVDESKLIISNKLSLEELAIVEPLSVGAHAVRRANIQAGDKVVVVGAGPIGIAVMIYASLAGANVVAADVNPWRLGFCNGIRNVQTVEGSPVTAFDRIRTLTEGAMAHTVFDATGNLQAIESAFQLMGHGGKYVLVGLQKGNISFSHPEFHKREATLMSSRNATKEDFLFVMDSIATKQVDPLSLVTQRIPFDDAIDAFGQLLQPGSRAIKALIEM